MSVELKINEIDNSNHENKILERGNEVNEDKSVLKLDSTNISDAIAAAEKLNLNVESNKPSNEENKEAASDEKESQSLSESDISTLLLKQLLANKNTSLEKTETSIEEDVKNLTSKVLKKHLIPSLKNFLSTLD